jgi:transposase InsO family protein
MSLRESQRSPHGQRKVGYDCHSRHAPSARHTPDVQKRHGAASLAGADMTSRSLVNGRSAVRSRSPAPRGIHTPPLCSFTFGCDSWPRPLMRARPLWFSGLSARFCVSAAPMARERTRPVCVRAGRCVSRLRGAAADPHRQRESVYGKVRAPPVEVLFDKICRENGVDHLLTAPRSPATTGKIERFHRSLRAEFDTRRVFSSLRTAQQALDEWVEYYNTERPHQAIGIGHPGVPVRVLQLQPVEPTPCPRARGIRADHAAPDHEGRKVRQDSEYSYG